jgi:hypothetical protein
MRPEVIPYQTAQLLVVINNNDSCGTTVSRILSGINFRVGVSQG